jgi:hypothetical protein
MESASEAKRALALLQKDVYERHKTELLTDGRRSRRWRIVALHSHFCGRGEKEGGE